ncbi:hypothetical protein M8C21_021087 [Ambrosia artemisiifolia]|uniref:Protein kinase domain-containing protein n=1 Tax=Ambrosia artemisiifolia TaxID=4212 RepID=A0AAD5GDZ7_AMBAR|nr:hypothetical protein M8C21_021087 [Ambrosia artemisiifolia]
MNCNCTAYANLDISNGGSGCLLWFDELIDIRDYDTDHNIYIRTAASELAGHQSESNRRKRVVTGDMEYALDKKNSGVQTQHVGDIPFISLYKLAKATNNFSVSNKIGEGGFGPVYKGVLEDGQEVAVKRLSDTSQQGIEEFKNELISISKLQHRNLMKREVQCLTGLNVL